MRPHDFSGSAIIRAGAAERAAYGPATFELSRPMTPMKEPAADAPPVLPAAAAAAEPIPDCPHCRKPPALCVCDGIVPIDNKVSLLILQHPQEQDRELGTARLAALHFKDSLLKIGLSWASLSKI